MDPTAVSDTPSTAPFDPPTKGQFLAQCANCGQSVTVLMARIVNVTNDGYLVEGRCKRCGEPVHFSV